MNKVNKLLLEKRKNYKTVKSSDFKDENELLNYAATIMKDGADVIEFNGNNLNDCEFLKISKKLRDLSGVFNTLLIITGRIDIAKLCEADGVVLDKNSVPVDEGKKVTENQLILGYRISEEMNFDEIEFKDIDFVVTDREIPSPVKIFSENNK